MSNTKRNTNENNRILGTRIEAEAKSFLINLGYQIIECNFRCKSGEIDIIAKEDNYLVFIEVKFRFSTKNGLPAEAVDFRKMKRIINTAKYYMLIHGYSEFTPCRFDVIVKLDTKMELIKNAFDAG